jgi:hypothetical protein
MLKYQKLSEKFITKNIYLDKIDRETENENISTIIKWQKNLSPEFIKKYYGIENVHLLNHNFDENYKISLMKKFDITSHELYKFNIKFTENIINFIMECKKYNNHNILTIFFEEIKKNIHQEKILNYFNICTEKLIKKDEGYLKLYFKIMFTNQIYIPDSIFEKFAKFKSSLSDKKKNMFKKIVSQNKNLYINKYVGKLLGINPRLNSMLITIKKYKDIKIFYKL